VRSFVMSAVALAVALLCPAVVEAAPQPATVSAPEMIRPHIATKVALAGGTLLSVGYDQTTHQLVSAVRSGGTWTRAVVSGAQQVRAPSFDVAGAGAGTRVVVAWTTGPGGSAVYVRTFDTASGWGPITTLTHPKNPNVSSGQVQVAVSPTRGRASVMWQEAHSSGAPSVLVARLRPSGSWDHPARTPVMGHVDVAKIETADTGKIFVATISGQSVWLTSLRVTKATWTAPQRLTRHPGTLDESLALAVNSRAAVAVAWGLPDTHTLHTWVRSGDPTHQVITAHVSSSATDAEYALSLGTHLTAALVFASPSRRAPTASVSLLRGGVWSSPSALPEAVPATTSFLHVAVAATPDGTALIGVDPIFEDSSHGYTDHPLALDLYRADVAGVVSPIGSIPGFAAKGGDPVHLLVSSREQLAAWTHLASRTYVATVT
jgi:hypothetical protein